MWLISCDRSFDVPWPEDATNQIQFIFYFGLIMSCYPAFFALYPTRERLLNIKALQYGNGARPLPLWYYTAPYHTLLSLRLCY